MTKQLFDDVIGEVPPSTVDVDAAISRGRRAARLHRLTSPVAAATAGVVLVTGAVAVALLPSGGNVSPGGGSQAGRCLDGVPTAPPLAERSEEAASRLTGVLGPLVGQRLPAGSRLGGPTDHPEHVVAQPLVFAHVHAEPRSLGGPGDCYLGEDYFSANADVSWDSATGAVSVAVGRLGGRNMPMDKCVSSAEESFCASQTGPRGERVILVTITLDGVVRHRVDMAKPDGTWVMLSATNDIRPGEGGLTAPVPPLTREQLLQIALDPALTLYPQG
jgi:hypothetical protein